MAVDLAFVLPTVAGAGAVVGWLGKHFTNGRFHKAASVGDDRSVAEAEFRGEMRQVVQTLAKTTEKSVDLMGLVHEEISHTNAVLEILERRSQGQEEAIRKVLGK